jgi:PEP-CTERM motif
MVKKAAYAIAAVAVLVLIVAVSGAFADGVRHDTHQGLLVSSEAVYTFHPSGSFHADFGVLNHEPESGIRNGYFLRESWFGGKYWGDNHSQGSDPLTTSPEPGTLVLLIAGVCGLFFARRREAPNL